MFLQMNIVDVNSSLTNLFSMSASHALIFLTLGSILAASPFQVMMANSSRTYESVEFLEGVEERTADQQGNFEIATKGFWLDRPTVSIQVSSDASSKPAATTVNGMVSGNTTMNGSYSQWNDLLSVFQQKSVPRLSLTNKDISADIKIFLSSSSGEDGRPGKTRVVADKITGEIIRAEVYIYSADKLEENGMLQYVVAHELGHALGLSHSTDPESMMYPLIELEDGHVVNHLGSCEVKGISALYLESKIGSEEC